jgi:ABC-type phosphate/phosphonate transport system substrate-binding protein
MNKDMKPLLITVMTILALSASIRPAVAKPYLFTAPPLQSAKKDTAMYAPIAAYLSKAIGRPVTYVYPDNWLSYEQNMQENKYDIIYDGPHFIGWRMAHLGNVPLVKLPGKLKFVVFVKASNKSIKSLADLDGRTICGLAPPNLATLSMYMQFPNPVRQPMVISTGNFPKDYKMVMKGKCTAGVMRDKMLFRLEKKIGGRGRIVWTSKGLTSLGFSASSRVTSRDKKKIILALTAPGAQGPLRAFFNRFSRKNRKLLPATTQDYAGMGSYLRDVYGFTQ